MLIKKRCFFPFPVWIAMNYLTHSHPPSHPPKKKMGLESGIGGGEREQLFTNYPSRLPRQGCHLTFLETPGEKKVNGILINNASYYRQQYHYISLSLKFYLVCSLQKWSLVHFFKVSQSSINGNPVQRLLWLYAQTLFSSLLQPQCQICWSRETFFVFAKTFFSAKLFSLSIVVPSSFFHSFFSFSYFNPQRLTVSFSVMSLEVSQICSKITYFPIPLASIKSDVL